MQYYSLPASSLYILPLLLPCGLSPHLNPEGRGGQKTRSTMSFYSPALHHRRAPKLCLKQQHSSLPLVRTTSSTKSRTTSSTYTRSSSVKNPTSSCSSNRSPLATDTAELDSWGLTINKRTSSSRESLQVTQKLWHRKKLNQPLPFPFPNYISVSKHYHIFFWTKGFP